MKADTRSTSLTLKEVTMTKRLLVVAIVLAAILIFAAPALAFNGLRADYTSSATCASCHTTGPGPAVYNDWASTNHGTDAEAVPASKMLPYGNVCQGCHTANFDPSKAVPTPVATSSTGAVTWQVANGLPGPTVIDNAAASEPDIGCSSCHQGMGAAHAAPFGNLANADICGQCHSRYAYTVDTYSVAPVPYLQIDASGSPVPNPSPTTLIQPQMALGFLTMGSSSNNWTPTALSTVLNVPHPGWTPTPNPAATKAAGLMQYWTTTDGKTLPWTQSGHDGSATQYTDWSMSKHASALKDLKAVVGPNPPASCLKCHSADYMIAPAKAKPTGAQAKYGVTCVACHDPHSKGTAKGIWDAEFSPQLTTNSQKTLCIQCHTAQLNGKTAVPGSTVHNDQKEIMQGVGAIGVKPYPGVHQGKCVQCHMPPTTVSGHGGVQLGANHTMDIIMPQVAADTVPVSIGGYTGPMPFSACTTCHSRTGDQDATWLQDTIDQRQADMHAWYDRVTAALTKAAKRLGYKNTAAANTAINKIPMKKWTNGQMNFQKAFTNQTYIGSEGSWGIHNWQYARDVILTALDQANAVRK